MARIDKSGAQWVHKPAEWDPGIRPDGNGGVQVAQGAGIGTDGSGNLIVKTLGSGAGNLGKDGSGNIIIPALAVDTANLAAGSLGDLSKYSSTVRAVTVVFSLPSLPSTSYPSARWS